MGKSNHLVYKVGPITEYLYSAVLMKIVDGDTYDFLVHWQRDIGFHITVKQEYALRSRAYGINTPETNRAESKVAGLAAKAFVQEWFTTYGTVVTIKTYKDSGDKYGRYLVEVWDKGMTACLNRDLVNAGHAIPYMV